MDKPPLSRYRVYTWAEVLRLLEGEKHSPLFTPNDETSAYFIYYSYSKGRIEAAGQSIPDPIPYNELEWKLVCSDDGDSGTVVLSIGNARDSEE